MLLRVAACVWCVFHLVVCVTLAQHVLCIHVDSAYVLCMFCVDCVYCLLSYQVLLRVSFHACVAGHAAHAAARACAGEDQVTTGKQGGLKRKLLTLPLLILILTAMTFIPSHCLRRESIEQGLHLLSLYILFLPST